MYLETKDWSKNCLDKKAFDKYHFTTLLMKEDFDVDISDQDYLNVFGCFKEKYELIDRLKNYYADINYRVEINDIKRLDPELNDLDVADDIDDYILELSDKLKKSLLDNSVKGNVELSDYWNQIDFRTITN